MRSNQCSAIELSVSAFYTTTELDQREITKEDNFRRNF
jgi:hypothetical protein